MTQPDPIQLQRLVDGELSNSQRTEFLSSIEDQEASAWREVALAFIEEQVFAESLGSISRPDVVTEVSHENIVNEESHPEVSRRKTRRGFPLSGLVAMLLLGIAGFLAGRLSVPNDVRIAATAQTPSTENETVEQSPETVDVPGTEQPQGELARAALEGSPRLQSADQHLVSLQSELQLVSEGLQRHGYRFDTKTEFVPARFADGREDVVPVHTLSINYHGQ